MTHLILVRHADTGIPTSTNPADEITRRGYQQAELLAERLLGLSLNQFISSPLKRTIQTADVVSQNLNMIYQVDEDLVEIVSLAQLPKALEKSAQFLSDVTRRYIDQRILVITHGNRIRSLIAVAFNLSFSDVVNFNVGNTSITLLEHDPEDEQYQLNLLNDTAHLGKLKLW